MIEIRPAVPADIDGISDVRHAVIENAQTREQLAALGITAQSVADSLVRERRGWVAEETGRIVGFAIADGATASLFALFVQPGHERRGTGRRLLEVAVRWLWDQGLERLWLTTGAGTRAVGFYQSAGWICTGSDRDGDLRFELWRTRGAGSRSCLPAAGGVHTDAGETCRADQQHDRNDGAGVKSGDDP